MCGIYGYITRGRISNGEKFIIEMERTLTHRGPDQKGFYINDVIGMGFVRLAIIDLSSAANQPMSDESKKFWIAYNGEIFNYVELRKELMGLGYLFRSSSDTEVVLKAYMQWGLECFNKFRGMWALVIWDKVKNKIIASRDYFGIKPLYFLQGQNTIFWSSEIKAFNCLGFQLEEDIETICDYLEYDLLDTGENTFFKNIWQLKPGQIVIIDQNLNTSKYEYWLLKDAVRQTVVPLSEKKQIDKFRIILFDSIKISLRSDVPVWILLSGGLDSSSIVSIVRHLNSANEINAISVVHDEQEINEYEYAKVVAQQKNCNLQIIKIDNDAWVDDLDKFIYHQDEPVSSTTAVNHWFLMKELHKRGIKAVISGQGIDEILYGYIHTTMGYHFADLLKKGHLLELIKEFYWHNKHKSYISRNSKEFYIWSLKGFIPQWLAKIAKASFFENSRFFIDYSKLPANINREKYETPNIPYTNLLNNAFYRMLKVESIPRILHYEDRNSMAFSIEQRVPFLDRDIVSYVFALPSKMKVRNGVSKWILREALKGILPDRIRSRLSKLGFTAPEEKWIRSKEFQQYVQNKRIMDILKNSPIDVPAFHNKISQFLKGEIPYNKTFWRIYNYAMWKQRFISKP